MPAPEQTPSVEEGLQQTTQETSSGPGMESETTATTILASVKEQVLIFLCNRSEVMIFFQNYIDITHLKSKWSRKQTF